MIPLPELLSEVMLGIGAALFGANLLVLIRSRRAQDEPQRGSKGSPPPRPAAPRSIGRVYVNMAVGAVVALWGLATILTR